MKVNGVINECSSESSKMILPYLIYYCKQYMEFETKVLTLIYPYVNNLANSYC